jgi:hypothetical protein
MSQRRELKVKYKRISDTGRERLEELREGAACEHPHEELLLEIFSRVPSITFDNISVIIAEMLRDFGGDPDAAVRALRSGGFAIVEAGMLQ